MSAVILMLFGALTIFSAGFVSWARNQLLMALFVLIMASLCGMILPYRRRDLFESSPKVVGGKIAGIPAISLIAGLSL